MAVTSGPWLLTTVVLVVMRVSAVRAGIEGIFRVEQIITVVYASVMVLSAPIDIVLSRYASDQMYEGRPDRIAAPVRNALAGTMLAFVGAGAAAMMLLGAPLRLAVPGAALAVIVGGQWLLLSAAGGLSTPGTILRAFAWGAPVSVGAAVLLSRHGGGDAGYLVGFGAGQVLTLGLLMRGTFAALPEEEDEQVHFLPALRRYRMLALSVTVLHAGLWVDKLVVYIGRGGQVASVYAALAAVAWLSVVPAAAHLFVRVETRFYRSFRAFYRDLSGGASLADLEVRARRIREEAAGVLRGTALVQAMVSLLGVVLAPRIAAGLGLPAEWAGTLRVLFVGASLQMIALAATLLLHYFDFRRAALVTACVLFFANLSLSAATCGASILGLGYTVACVLCCATAVMLLRNRLDVLLEHTFQSQPYAET